MSNITWGRLAEIAGCEFEDLTSMTLDEAGIELTDLANGTILGDEIINDLVSEGIIN